MIVILILFYSCSWFCYYFPGSLLCLTVSFPSVCSSITCFTESTQLSLVKLLAHFVFEMTCCANLFMFSSSNFICLRLILYLAFVTISLFKCWWRTLVTILWIKRSLFTISSWSFHAFNQYQNCSPGPQHSPKLFMEWNSQEIDLTEWLMNSNFALCILPYFFLHFQRHCRYSRKQTLNEVLGSYDHCHYHLLPSIAVDFTADYTSFCLDKVILFNTIQHVGYLGVKFLKGWVARKSLTVSDPFPVLFWQKLRR